MKRSHIFLGITTACLPIAGIVAAKVSRFGAVRTAYYIPPGTTSCLPTKVTCIFNPNAQAVCTVHGVPAYTNNGCTQVFLYNTL